MFRSQKTFKFTVPLRKISQLYKSSLSRQIDIDIDEDEEYDKEGGSRDSLSVFSDETFTFNIDTSVPENVSLPSSEPGSSDSSIELQIKSAPGYFDYRLTPLETVCVATVIEEANDKLESIKSILPPYQYMELNERTNFHDKYSRPKERKLIFPEEGEVSVETQQMKFQRVRHCLSEVLKRLNIEIKRESTYNSLREWIKAEGQMKVDKAEFWDEARENERVIKGLKSELNATRRRIGNVMGEAKKEIEGKDAKIHNVVCKGQLEKRSVNKWEDSRGEQCEYMAAGTEEVLQCDLEYAKTSVEQETRVNSEIEEYLELVENEMLEAVEEWQNRYDNDLEEKTQMIEQLRQDKEETMERYLEMKTIYRQRQIAIDEYKLVRNERIKRMELEELRENMALKIQAWWRGTMVRNGLGRYNTRKKKKRGKRGESNKSNKKRKQ